MRPSRAASLAPPVGPGFPARPSSRDHRIAFLGGEAKCKHDPLRLPLGKRWAAHPRPLGANGRTTFPTLAGGESDDAILPSARIGGKKRRAGWCQRAAVDKQGVRWRSVRTGRLPARLGRDLREPRRANGRRFRQPRPPKRRNERGPVTAAATRSHLATRSAPGRRCAPASRTSTSRRRSHLEQPFPLERPLRREHPDHPEAERRSPELVEAQAAMEEGAAVRPITQAAEALALKRGEDDDVWRAVEVIERMARFIATPTDEDRFDSPSRIGRGPWRTSRAGQRSSLASYVRRAGGGVQVRA